MKKRINYVLARVGDGRGGGKRWLKVTAFGLVFFLILEGLQFVLQDKWCETSNSFARIQLMSQEEEQPDVVFIGSSVVFRGINPLQLFQEYGISSYDFAPPNQSMEVTRFYVEEAIKTASPKLIVLEPLRFLNFPLNEQRTRWWLDPMPLNLEKLKTIVQLYSENERFDLHFDLGGKASWVFPLLRYHSRWKELTANDFVLDQRVRFYHGAEHYHGYGTHFGANSVKIDVYNDQLELDEAVIAEAEKYFEQIVKLCDESGTELLVLRMPSGNWRRVQHDVVSRWADEYGVSFIDYNDDSSLLEELQLDMDTDFVDDVHMNDNGASKLSAHLGRLLHENYDLPDHRGEPEYADWDQDWQVYQHDKAAWELSHETDWGSYLEKLQDPDYSVYIACKDNVGGGKHPELTGQLKTLGLMPELETAGAVGYLAVIDGGEVIYEVLEDEPLEYETVVGGHHIEMVSEGYHQGNRASVRIDGAEHCMDRRGLQIVVYDNVLEDVVDSVTFDLWDGGKVYR